MLNRLFEHRLLALVVSGFLLLPAGVSAQADTPPQSQTPPEYQQAPAQQAEIDSQTLDNFAAAYSSVQSIQQDYAKQLEKVEDPNKANELRQQAQEKMQKAVSSSGVSLSQYQNIVNQAGQDAELRSRIQKRLSGES